MPTNVDRPYRIGPGPAAGPVGGALLRETTRRRGEASFHSSQNGPTGEAWSFPSILRWANTASRSMPKPEISSAAVPHPEVAREGCYGPSVRWRPAHHRACVTSALHRVLRARPMARGQNRWPPAYALCLGVRLGCPSCGGPLTFGAHSTATAGSSLSGRAVRRSTVSSHALAAAWRFGSLAPEPAEYGLPNPALKRTATGKPASAA